MYRNDLTKFFHTIGLHDISILKVLMKINNQLKNYLDIKTYKLLFDMNFNEFN